MSLNFVLFLPVDCKEEFVRIYPRICSENMFQLHSLHRKCFSKETEFGIPSEVRHSGNVCSETCIFIVLADILCYANLLHYF